MAIKGLSRLQKKLDKMIPDEKKLAERAAEKARELIVERVTKTGKDRYGRKFHPYSKSTIKYRQKRGKQTQYVDLKDTGSMFEALVVKPAHTPKKGRAKVVFDSRQEEDKALGHQRGIRGRLPQREFFGLTVGERRQIVKLVGRKVEITES